MTDFSPDEVYQAARLRHFRGDFYSTPEVTAARKARDDLTARTWADGRDMTRDEKRLYARYSKTLDAETRSDVLAYREHLRQLSQKSRELGAALTSLREQET